MIESRCSITDEQEEGGVSHDAPLA